jgi:hypothetical protein
MDNFIDELYENWIDEFNLTPLTSNRLSEFDEAIRLNQQLVNNMTNIRRRIIQNDQVSNWNRNQQEHNAGTFWRDFFDIVFNMNTEWNNLDEDANENMYEDVKVTLTQEQFDQIPRKKLKSEDIIEYDGKECNICMDIYNLDNIVIKLGCRHEFHKDCIENWLCKEKITCPVCRKDIREFVK